MDHEDHNPLGKEFMFAANADDAICHCATEAQAPNPTEPFFLIVADFDMGLFSVEGPMTDDGPWPPAARGKSSVVSYAVRPARIGSFSPRNSNGRTTWATLHPAASCGHVDERSDGSRLTKPRCSISTH